MLNALDNHFLRIIFRGASSLQKTALLNKTAKLLPVIVFALITLCMLPSNSLASAEQNKQAVQGDRFSLGKITPNPARQYKRMQPMAELLATELGYLQGGSVFTKNIPDMQEKMRAGEVDLVTGSAFEASVLIASGVGEILALKSKRGKRDYNSIIVVRKDSPIESIDELGGKTIAFEDPGSTSAYRVPYILLDKLGFALSESSSPPTGDKHINYQFSGNEQNSSALLYRGLVDAIALSDNDWQDTENVPLFQKNQFRIIYTSPPIPRSLEVVRSSLDKKSKNRLRQILLDLHKNAKAELVMEGYHKTTEFSPVTEEALQYIRELGEFFKQ